MAKRKTFEDLLNTPFRWPTMGDRPFVIADDPMDNATIADDNFTRLVFMIEGYKEAADLMVQASEEKPILRDILVFPIIFNYRQFLELSLKYQIATHGQAVGIEANWSTHKLEDLWAIFSDMLERYGSTDPDEADPIVEEAILEFAKIDPGSYSYRYPVDRLGRALPVTFNNLHLPTLADVMKAVAGYFSGCDGYLSARQP